MDPDTFGRELAHEMERIQPTLRRHFERLAAVPAIVPSAQVPAGSVFEVWTEPLIGPITHLDANGVAHRDKVLTRYVNDEDYRRALQEITP